MVAWCLTATEEAHVEAVARSHVDGFAATRTAIDIGTGASWNVIVDDGRSTANAWNAKATHTGSIGGVIKVVDADIVNNASFRGTAKAWVARKIILDTILVDTGVMSLLRLITLKTRAHKAIGWPTGTDSNGALPTRSPGLLKRKLAVEFGALMWGQVFQSSSNLIVAVDWHGQWISVLEKSMVVQPFVHLMLVSVTNSAKEIEG